MNISIDTTDPLSLANIRACALASRLAYESPTFTDPATGESVFIQDCGSATVIAFPGTHDLRDVFRDLDCLRREVMITGHPCAVHRGFDDTFNALQRYIVATLQRSNNSTPLFITGHSKGAAVAKRFAIELALSIPHSALRNPKSVITFGEPRGGDSRYAKIYNDALASRTLRVTNAADPVPWLPGWLAGNRHCGPEAFMPARKDVLVTGPALLSKIWSDGREIYQAWQLKQLAPLADHHIDNYLRRLNFLNPPSNS